VAKIDNIEVRVSVAEGFSVVLADNGRLNVDEMFWINMFGTGVGRLVGAEIVESRRKKEDAERAKTFSAAIAEINLQRLARKALIDGLQSSLRFKSVTAVTEPTGPPPTGAGILRVRIENWGLYAGSREDATLQQVQVGLNATASLIGGDGKLAWEHRDHFTGGVHRSIGEYGSSPVLLTNEIEDTVRRYCDRVVNEIRYGR
jgi:hypothetical protein